MSEDKAKYEVETTTNGWAAALVPANSEQAWKIAECMAKSQLVPKAYQGRPSDILIAGAMGARLGLDPFSAMSGIAVVNGRPTLYGDAMLAVCSGRKDWRGLDVIWKGESEVTVTVKRAVADGSIVTSSGTFSVDDAKKSGLWGKQGPWTQYPKRMLELRARAFALRNSYADALLGFYAREEMEGVIEVEATDVTPKRKKSVSAFATVTVPAENTIVEGNNEEPKEDSAVPLDTPESHGQTEESTPTSVEITDDAIRKEVNVAAGYCQGGIKAVRKTLSDQLGYEVKKLEDIKEEDKAKVLSICDEISSAQGE
jgi:hypothetical protein